MRQTNFRRIAAALLALVLVLGAAGSVLGAADAKASPPSVLPAKAEPKTGVTVYANDKASIDASNLAEGYVMVKYTGGKQVKIKVQITKSGTSTTYTWDTPS